MTEADGAPSAEGPSEVGGGVRAAPEAGTGAGVGDSPPAAREEPRELAVARVRAHLKERLLHEEDQGAQGDRVARGNGMWKLLAERARTKERMLVRSDSGDGGGVGNGGGDGDSATGSHATVRPTDNDVPFTGTTSAAMGQLTVASMATSPVASPALPMLVAPAPGTSEGGACSGSEGPPTSPLGSDVDTIAPASPSVPVVDAGAVTFTATAVANVASVPTSAGTVRSAAGVTATEASPLSPTAAGTAEAEEAGSTTWLGRDGQGVPEPGGDAAVAELEVWPDGLVGIGSADDGLNEAEVDDDPGASRGCLPDGAARVDNDTAVPEGSSGAGGVAASVLLGAPAVEFSTHVGNSEADEGAGCCVAARAHAAEEEEATAEIVAEGKAEAKDTVLGLAELEQTVAAAAAAAATVIEEGGIAKGGREAPEVAAVHAEMDQPNAAAAAVHAATASECAASMDHATGAGGTACAHDADGASAGGVDEGLAKSPRDAADRDVAALGDTAEGNSNSSVEGDGGGDDGEDADPAGGASRAVVWQAGLSREGSSEDEVPTGGICCKGDTDVGPADGAESVNDGGSATARHIAVDASGGEGEEEVAGGDDGGGEATRGSRTGEPVEIVDDSEGARCEGVEGVEGDWETTCGGLLGGTEEGAAGTVAEGLTQTADATGSAHGCATAAGPSGAAGVPQEEEKKRDSEVSVEENAEGKGSILLPEAATQAAVTAGEEEEVLVGKVTRSRPSSRASSTSSLLATCPSDEVRSSPALFSSTSAVQAETGYSPEGIEPLERDDASDRAQRQPCARMHPVELQPPLCPSCDGNNTDTVALGPTEKYVMDEAATSGEVPPTSPSPEAGAMDTSATEGAPVKLAPASTAPLHGSLATPPPVGSELPTPLDAGQLDAQSATGERTPALPHEFPNAQPSESDAWASRPEPWRRHAVWDDVVDIDSTSGCASPPAPCPPPALATTGAVRDKEDRDAVTTTTAVDALLDFTPPLPPGLVTPPFLLDLAPAPQLPPPSSSLPLLHHQHDNSLAPCAPTSSATAVPPPHPLPLVQVPLGSTPVVPPTFLPPAASRHTSPVRPRYPAPAPPSPHCHASPLSPVLRAVSFTIAAVTRGEARAPPASPPSPPRQTAATSPLPPRRGSPTTLPPLGASISIPLPPPREAPPPGAARYPASGVCPPTPPPNHTPVPAPCVPPALLHLDHHTWTAATPCAALRSPPSATPLPAATTAIQTTTLSDVPPAPPHAMACSAASGAPELPDDGAPDFSVDPPPRRHRSPPPLAAFPFASAQSPTQPPGAGAAVATAAVSAVRRLCSLPLPQVSLVIEDATVDSATTSAATPTIISTAASAVSRAWASPPLQLSPIRTPPRTPAQAEGGSSVKEAAGTAGTAAARAVGSPSRGRPPRQPALTQSPEDALRARVGAPAAPGCVATGGRVSKRERRETARRREGGRGHKRRRRERARARVSGGARATRGRTLREGV